MEKALSLNFPIITPEGEVIVLIPQITLYRGLEDTFEYSIGNVEGRKVTEEYINRTFKHYAIRKEKEEISQQENPERWTVLQNQEEVNIETIKQYQLSETIIQFSNAVKRREEIVWENQKRALEEALSEINTAPATLPQRESLLITAPPITTASSGRQTGIPPSTNNPVRMRLLRQRRKKNNHQGNSEGGGGALG